MQYDKAVECFDEAIKLKGDFAKAFHNKATALYEMENYKESLEMFDKAIKVIYIIIDCRLNQQTRKHSIISQLCFNAWSNSMMHSTLWSRHKNSHPTWHCFSWRK
jgi:tetratricopeptide (TPR) repeat protein